MSKHFVRVYYVTPQWPLYTLSCYMKTETSRIEFYIKKLLLREEITILTVAITKI